MKILIGGDFAPTVYNFELFEKGDLERLYTKEMLEYLKGFDYRVFDFETVFDGEGEKIKKCGPHIIAPATTLPGIKGIDPNLLILANNHINNLGAQGIRNTIDILEREAISHIGAGSNLDDARKTLYIKESGMTIGFYACGEHEYNAADEDRAGINAYDPLTVFDDIRKAKERCDHLIVFYHGGVIEFRYPLRGERKALQKMVDCGADVVIGQHTHCIGCMENYKGKTIIYGQGDFLFARPTRNEFRYSGLLIELNVSKDGVKVDYNVRIKPLDTIRMANTLEKEEILDEYFQRSSNLLDKEEMKKIYSELMNKCKRKYFGELLGRKGRTYSFRGLSRILGSKYVEWIMRCRFNETNWLSLDNDLTCEAHREILTDLVNSQWNKAHG